MTIHSLSMTGPKWAYVDLDVARTSSSYVDPSVRDEDYVCVKCGATVLLATDKKLKEDAARLRASLMLLAAAKKRKALYAEFVQQAEKLDSSSPELEEARKISEKVDKEIHDLEMQAALRSTK